MMIRTYFRSKGKLIRFESNSGQVGLAQVETWLFACEQGRKPEGPVLAVLNGGRAA